MIMKFENNEKSETVMVLISQMMKSFRFKFF
jgi:hypothetical protein